MFSICAVEEGREIVAQERFVFTLREIHFVFSFFARRARDLDFGVRVGSPP
jgi:hypothetical protein